LRKKFKNSIEKNLKKFKKNLQNSWRMGGWVGWQKLITFLAKSLDIRGECINDGLELMGGEMKTIYIL
jgi:hypothetical protein